MYDGSSQVMTIVMVVMGDVRYNFDVMIQDYAENIWGT